MLYRPLTKIRDPKILDAHAGETSFPASLVHEESGAVPRDFPRGKGVFHILDALEAREDLQDLRVLQVLLEKAVLRL